MIYYTMPCGHSIPPGELSARISADAETGMRKYNI